MSRTEVQLQIQTSDGPKTVTILSDVTVDDLMRVGLKAYVHEARLGTEYTSPFSREIRDAVARVRVSQRA
jgi:hypothetical protein